MANLFEHCWGAAYPSPTGKGSASRAENKKNLFFFYPEAQPTLRRQATVVQAEHNGKFIWTLLRRSLPSPPGNGSACRAENKKNLFFFYLLEPASPSQKKRGGGWLIAINISLVGLHADKVTTPTFPRQWQNAKPNDNPQKNNRFNWFFLMASALQSPKRKTTNTINTKLSSANHLIKTTPTTWTTHFTRMTINNTSLMTHSWPFMVPPLL